MGLREEPKVTFPKTLKELFPENACITRKDVQTYRSKKFRISVYMGDSDTITTMELYSGRAFQNILIQQSHRKVKNEYCYQDYVQ